jgi:hypothetical protein
MTAPIDITPLDAATILIGESVDTIRDHQPPWPLTWPPFQIQA